MPSDEPFDIKKQVSGFMDPAMLRKALPLLWWMIIFFFMLLGAFVVTVKVKNLIFPKAQTSPVQVQTNSGCIETGADKRSKIGVINF